MSPVSGTALLPSTTAIVRCGSHLAVSRSQLSFSDAGQMTIAG